MDRMKRGTRNAASANLFDLTALPNARGISLILVRSRPSALVPVTFVSAQLFFSLNISKTPWGGLFFPRRALRETLRIPRSRVPAQPVFLRGPPIGGNRPLSALIRNLGNGSQIAWKSFGNRPRLHVNMLCDQSPDPALNRGTRRLSMPDRKSSLEKRGGLAQSIS